MDDAQGGHPQHHGPAIVAAAALWGVARGRARAHRRVRGRDRRVRAGDACHSRDRRRWTRCRIRSRATCGRFPADELHVLSVGRVRDGGRRSSAWCSTRARTPRPIAARISGSASRDWCSAAAPTRRRFCHPLHPRSRFWTTSVSFFFIRLGVMVAALGAAWLWEQRPTRGAAGAPSSMLGPIVAVRLLDPRRAGLRPDFAAAARRVFAARGRGLGCAVFCAADARRGGPQGAA